MIAFDREHARVRRKRRIRTHLSGSPERPRLCVYRSLRHIYAQIVDDHSGATLVAASTMDPILRKAKVKDTVDVARQVGELIADRAVALKIRRVVFDRGGYLYHGRIKALADAARGKGLEF